MPWHVERNGCPDGEPWAVIKDDDGSIAGCHPSESAADAQVAALYANEDKMSTRTTFPRPTPVATVASALGTRFAKAKVALIEADAPAKSPGGAPFAEFKDGKAMYADGSVFDGSDWSGATKKAGWKFARAGNR